MIYKPGVYTITYTDDTSEEVVVETSEEGQALWDKLKSGPEIKSMVKSAATGQP